MPFAATWMDLEMIILHEVRQRKTNIIGYRLYVESKNNGTNELIYKAEIAHGHRKQTMVTKGKSQGEE